MWSAYVHCKHFAIENVAKNAVPCSTLIQKNHLLSSPIIARVFDKHCSINYGSLVEAKGSGAGLKSRTKKGDKSDSFAVSYLVNSCGLSVERAVLLSKKVKFESLEKPNAVLGFLRDEGFSTTHIAKIVTSVPGVLFYDPEKTLLPKIEFFRSVWVSRTDLANALSANHHLLVYSLKNYILPIFNCFKSVLLTDDRIASTAMWRAAFYCKDPVKNLASNIAMLRELEVPEKHIRMSLANFPAGMMQDNDQFAEALFEVKEMGFDPSKSRFMMALHARSLKSLRSRWERCYEVYGNWGWSEDDICMAYKAHPGCMLISEQKLIRMMNFLVNNMGWNSRSIVGYSNVLCSSLEKKIIPRGSVIHLLRLKGLIKKDVSLHIFLVDEVKFLAKFVKPYVEQVPHIHDVYQGKMEIFPT